jgi:hypothetical protein
VTDPAWPQLTIELAPLWAGSGRSLLEQTARVNPNDGVCRVPLILIGISVRPFFSNSGSTTLRSIPLMPPPTACDTLASMSRLPRKFSVSDWSACPAS